jgi:DNA-binding transcriptional LysR family regulator
MDENFGLRELEAFVTIADCGSFTEAARRLLLTQPTISLRISSLEKSLAAKLLDRSRSRTRLTPAGKALLPHALATLRKRGEAMEAIREFKEGRKGPLRVGGSSIPGAYLLPRYLAAVQDRHPGLELQLQVGDTDTVLASLRAGEIELAVVGRRAIGRDLETAEIDKDRVLALAAPRCLRNHGFRPPRKRAASVKVATEELTRLPLILREQGSATRDLAIKRLADCGIRPADFASLLEVPGNTVALQAALAGLGLTFLSALAAREAMGVGELRTLEIPGFNSERPITLTRLKGRTLSPAAMELVGLLSNESS